MRARKANNYCLICGTAASRLVDLFMKSAAMYCVALGKRDVLIQVGDRGVRSGIYNGEGSRLIVKVIVRIGDVHGEKE